MDFADSFGWSAWFSWSISMRICLSAMRLHSRRFEGWFFTFESHHLALDESRFKFLQITLIQTRVDSVLVFSFITFFFGVQSRIDSLTITWFNQVKKAYRFIQNKVRVSTLSIYMNETTKGGGGTIGPHHTVYFLPVYFCQWIIKYKNKRRLFQPKTLKRFV